MWYSADVRTIHRSKQSREAVMCNALCCMQSSAVAEVQSLTCFFTHAVRDNEHN
jgi:hypothetical protein